VNNIIPDQLYSFFGAVCPIVFVIVLIRNIIKQKSLFGWLFPGGTTKIERIILFSCVFIFFVLIILG
jgi:hypothetical protein